MTLRSFPLDSGDCGEGLGGGTGATDYWLQSLIWNNALPSVAYASLINDRLSYTSFPSNSTVVHGASFDITVTALQGDTGLTDTQFTGAVTLTTDRFSWFDPAILAGTTTVNAVAGVATFTGLSLTSGGPPYPTKCAIRASAPSGSNITFAIQTMQIT